MSIIDISPIVSSATAVFPGDVPFRRSVSLDIDSGDNLTLSSVETTVHCGAHADAPSHYAPEGASIEARPLDMYIGPAQVVRVQLAPGERVLPQHLQGVEIGAPRVLFRTDSQPDPNHFNTDFNSLSPQLIDTLVAEGVVLVGIDTPSIDPADDKVLPSHQAVARHDMAILEGLVLRGVADGRYVLVALPLRLQGADASPVRAALIDDPADLVGGVF